MFNVTEPNYIHYTRIQTINADEARDLLATFELRGKKFGSKDEFENALKYEKKLASKVLTDAIRYNTIDSILGIESCIFNQFNEFEMYDFSEITIYFKEFCNWALNNNYNMPEVLIRLVRTSGEHVESIVHFVSEQAATGATSKSVENGAASNYEKAQQRIISKSGGKPKGSLSEALQHAYKKLRTQGNIAVLKKGAIRSFLKCLREMATEGNENHDDFISERIETVRAPNVGPCSVTTKTRKNSRPPYKTIEESDSYKANAISKQLTKLRNDYPLTDQNYVP